MQTYGYFTDEHLTARATYGQEQKKVPKPAPPAPAAPSHHAGYTLPSAPSGGASDPRLAAWLDEQEAAKERRAKWRKRRLKQQRREAEQIQNQPWFYPTVIGGGTLLVILFAAAIRR